MDELQDNRAGCAPEVTARLADHRAQNDLMLQTPLHALDENNAFNALGMRRLAEIIALNKKERAAIDADAEVSVRQSQLDATKRKLTIAREEEEAMIAQSREIEIARARSMAETAEEQAASEQRREAARIAREREVRLTGVARDRELRRKALESRPNVETTRAGNAAALPAKKAEAAVAEARLKTLPEVVERMMKPAEKIETIRINAISGLFPAATGGGGGGDKPAVNQVVDSVLSMALQLPAMQKLGEEVGMNIGDGLRGITGPLAERSRKAKDGEAAKPPD